MHRLIEVKDTIGFKMSHFEIFDKSDIPNFAFHFLYNKKWFEIIECHVQGGVSKIKWTTWLPCQN
jgi:hypothetical protein